MGANIHHWVFSKNEEFCCNHIAIKMRPLSIGVRPPAARPTLPSKTVTRSPVLDFQFTAGCIKTGDAK